MGNQLNGGLLNGGQPDGDDGGEDVANRWSWVAQQIIRRLVCSFPMTAAVVSTDRFSYQTEFLQMKSAHLTFFQLNL